MNAFFEELDPIRVDIESRNLTGPEWAAVVRARLAAIDKLMSVYKNAATPDRVAVAEKMRADLDCGTYPDLKEAAVDAATLEKALNDAVSSNVSGLL